MSTTSFLTEEQEQQIIEAIGRTENRTSGEVRVHIEHHCPQEPLERAATIFHDLGMDLTERKNGVLIYVASEDHKAAVFAGRGIHRQVEESFWQDVLDILLGHFKKGAFEEGIEKAVDKVGHKLSELYPARSGDTNELTDEISYENNKK